MIDRLKPTNRIDKQFVVCDIENRSDGSVICIDTYDGKDHVIHYDWAEWWCYVSLRASVDKCYRTIYAHNGGGWDWLSFLEWVVTRNPEQTFHTIENNGKLICLTVPTKSHQVKLVDSLYLFQSSLDKACETFLGERKIQLEHLPEWYWENDREKFWQYVHADTSKLYRCLLAFADLVYSKIAPISRLGLTLPSIAMRCFRTSYLKKDVSIPTNNLLRETLRNGYVGGRVEVFKPGKYRSINVYDFNSLYPSVMATARVPDTGNAAHTKRLHLRRCGVYRIRFKQGNTDRYPIFLQNGCGVYEGEGTYFENEIRRFIELANGDLTVLDGWVFESESVLFADYVDTLYGLRQKHKHTPIDTVAKLCMNSLYGKTAQRPERERTIRATTEEIEKLIESGACVDTLSEKYQIYRVREESDVPFEHVGIAGTITSEARARLWEKFDSGTVYCDTDSIHTTNTMQHNETKLGELKHEFSGSGVYCGKKLYALRDNNKEKIRIKGVRVGGENGHPIGFSDLCSLLDGAKIACKFRAASTFQSVLSRKGIACQFNPRKRTIQATLNH